jgi:cation diffusion facilitator family transporter
MMSDSAHQHTKGNLKVQAIAVAVGLLLLIIKFIAWVITGSNAILSDAVESIINVLAGSLALFSIYYANRPKDADHLYGHGKMEFVSSAFEGMLIFTAGVVIIGKAIFNLFFPQELELLGWGMALTTASGLVNFLLAWLLIKRGKQTHSEAMVADGKHLLSDAYSTVGMIVGLGAVWLSGQVWLDNAVAILFGLLLLRIGFKVTKRALAGILDETDLVLARQFIEILQANRRNDWIDVHNFRIIKFGAVLHVDCHVTVPWYYNVKQGHDIADQIERLVNRELGRQVELFIHLDPCLPQSCSLCAISDCEVRKAPFEKQLVWKFSNVLENKRHAAPKA